MYMEYYYNEQFTEKMLVQRGSLKFIVTQKNAVQVDAENVCQH